MTAVITEGRYTGEHLVSEANGSLSRKVVTISAGADLEPGTVLGRIVHASATTTAKPGNIGNGVFGAVTVGADAQVGNYIIKIVVAAANGGQFEVIDPEGDVVGLGTIAAAFSGGGIGFTIADGATDFIVGDSWTVAVAAGSGNYVQLDPNATDGSQHAAAVLYAHAAAASAAVKATVHIRQCEVKGVALTWPAGMTTDQKNAAIADLAERSIIVL